MNKRIIKKCLSSKKGWLCLQTPILIFIITIQSGFLLYTQYRNVSNSDAVPLSFLPTFANVKTNGINAGPRLPWTNQDYHILADVAKHVMRAEKHAKSMKALKETRLANDGLQKLYQSLHLNYSLVKARTVFPEAQSVCPEIYGGSEYGFPLFETGFFSSNCSFGKPLSSLVTIVNVFSNSSNANDFVQSVHTYFPSVNVLIGIRSKFTTEGNALLSKYINIKAVSFESETLGEIWNTLVQRVKTKYALIAKNVHEFDQHANIERLVREIERVQISVAGGSSRDTQSQHWTIGCYQRAFRNYTMVFQEGYDESINGCLICDHIDGPFLVTTKNAKKVGFDKNLQIGLFEDFFIRLGYENSIVCPDIMFHTHILLQSHAIKDWESFSSKHTVQKLIFTPGFSISFPCQNSLPCNKGKGLVIHPCCMEELNNMTNIVMTFCDKHDIICELNGGTLLAAVKMNMLFPWDVDSDIMFLLSNFSTLKSFISQIKTARFYSSLSQHPSYKNGSLVAGAYNYNSKNWFVEVYGKTELTTSKFRSSGKKQTKVLLYGTWVGAPANPGLWVRNRYGNDLYKHSEHWRHLGRKSQFIHLSKDTRRFSTCTKIGSHFCLDLFQTDGNILFADPVP